mmetsp:Transcript_11864/g.25474  ORF Transcript_11864/g.25474 Transcript_11864/m.25474 type:complete len:103 (-) Transcript_11864:284-592(-)
MIRFLRCWVNTRMPFCNIHLCAAHWNRRILVSMTSQVFVLSQHIQTASGSMAFTLQLRSPKPLCCSPGMPAHPTPYWHQYKHQRCKRSFNSGGKFSSDDLVH